VSSWVTAFKKPCGQSRGGGEEFCSPLASLRAEVWSIMPRGVWGWLPGWWTGILRERSWLLLLRGAGKGQTMYPVTGKRSVGRGREEHREDIEKEGGKFGLQLKVQKALKKKDGGGGHKSQKGARGPIAQIETKTVKKSNSITGRLAAARGGGKKRLQKKH